LEPDTIFVWNEEAFACILQQRFTVLRSESEMQATNLSNAKRMFVLAELNWDDRKLSDFYGFIVLKKLRFELRLRCPVIICSFCPKSLFQLSEETSFNQRKQRLFNVLDLPGQSFLPLPFEVHSLESYVSEPLSRTELEQVIDSFFDLDEVRDLVGSDSHPGTLLQNLHRLIRGIEGFKKGRTWSLSGIPYNNSLALNNIKRHLCLTVSVLDRYSFLEQIPENERESLRACLDPGSLIGKDFQFFVDHSENTDQRIAAFRENDPAGLLERFRRIAEALPGVRKCF
jgi:hypothetical protein